MWFDTLPSGLHRLNKIDLQQKVNVWPWYELFTSFSPIFLGTFSLVGEIATPQVGFLQ